MTDCACCVESDFLIANHEIADDETFYRDISTIGIGHGGHEALRNTEFFVPTTASEFFNPDIRDCDVAEIFQGVYAHQWARDAFGSDVGKGDVLRCGVGVGGTGVHR